MHRRPVTAASIAALVAVLVGAGLSVAAPAQAAVRSADPSGVVATVQGLNVAVSWTDHGSTGVTGYLVTTSPKSTPVSVPPGATSAVLTGLQPGVSYRAAVAAVTSSGAGTAVTATAVVHTTAPGDALIAVPIARILDTRTGLGAPKGSTHAITLTVAGRGGVPAHGAAAVALNLTVVSPTATGAVSTAATGAPGAASLRYASGVTTSALTVVPLSSKGQVTLTLNNSQQVTADVEGYAAPAAGSAGRFHAVPATRLIVRGTVPAGGSLSVPLAGSAGVPKTGVAAVVIGVAVVGATKSGSLRVAPAGSTAAVPVYSFAPVTTSATGAVTAGRITAGRVLAPVSSGGVVTLSNSSAAGISVSVDVAGWLTDGSDTSAGGAYFKPVTPYSLASTSAALAAGTVLPIGVAGRDGLPAATAGMPATSALLTVTAGAPTAATTATLYPSVGTRPTTGDLYAAKGVTAAALAVTPLGVDGKVDLVHSAGSARVFVSLIGYFIGDIHVPSSTLVPKAGAITKVSGSAGSTATVTIAKGSTAPKVGQVISAPAAATTPDGLLVQVTKVAVDGSGNTVATTQPATLSDAVGDANIDVAAPLGAADVVPSGSAARAIGLSSLEQRSTSGAGAPVTEKGKQPCSGSAGSEVDTTASFTPTLVFHAALGHHGFAPTITANAGIDVTEELGATYTYTAKGSCSLDKQLAKYTFRPITFDVAGVPVVVVPVFTLTLKAELSGKAEFTAGIDQKFHAQAGLMFVNGSVSPYHSITNTITHTGPKFTDLNGTASVALVGDLEGKLYDVAGPDVSLTATLTGKIDLLATPWWTVDFTLDAAAALHFKVLFKHVDVSVEVHLLAINIAHATTSGPPVITSTTLAPAQAGKAYSAQLTTHDGRAGTWSISGGSLPAGLHLAGSTVSGTPTTAGSYSFTVTFVDTAKRSTSATVHLTVAAAAASWPVHDNEGPPVLYAWFGANFEDPNWVSCDDTGDYCIARVDDDDVVQVIQLNGLEEVTTVPYATSDPVAELVGIGFTTTEAQTLVRPG